MAEKDRVNLQTEKDSKMVSFDYIARKSLEMGITTYECLDAQNAEEIERREEGEITVDD